VVGANEFRDRFGYWLDRAGGRQILITRHGRPVASLGPPNPQLATTDTAAVPAPGRDREESPPDTARTSP
jgi:antitoxin (DNA-binding transcriptional repressor) of toxin-antitoxin stability system